MQDSRPRRHKPAPMKKTYSAPEIHCNSCAGLIKDVLSEVPGLAGADVDVTAKTVTIDFADPAAEAAAMKGLAAEGYYLSQGSPMP
jgi:copper chaperone CopZ